MLHAFAEHLKNVEKYDTSVIEVSIWVGETIALIQREATIPILIHCRFGRDRTGIIVAALLLCIGVPEEREKILFG